MQNFKKIICILSILFSLSSNSFALDLNIISLFHSCLVKSDCYFNSRLGGIAIGDNPFYKSDNSVFSKPMVTTFINSDTSACTIVVNKKIIAVSINTILLAVIIAAGIAYQKGYFSSSSNSDNSDDDTNGDKQK